MESRECKEVKLAHLLAQWHPNYCTGGTGAGMRGVTGGASATLLSSFASEKNPHTLGGVFAKSVAASFSFGMGRARNDGFYC